jgi:Uma2 family endonuclease
MATTPTRLVTFAELEQVYTKDRRYELRHGELVEVPPAKFPHYRIQHQLRRLLEAVARDAGEVEIEFGFRALPEYEYRIADVVFVSREHWNGLPKDGYFEGAPEIVIEVLSPSNTAAEMLDKEQLCLKNGAKEFWVVDPRRNEVKVSTTDGRTATYKSGQQIPLYFGGSIPVDEIFAN